jgi:MFS transporter, putative metabolite:H+ symporter
MNRISKLLKHKHALLITVAALGYFVDIYDLILFNIVKKPSLRSIGVLEKDIEDIGILLFNMQMTGMLIGGLLWGVLGDLKGRLKVLFGSILLYSIANLVNAFAVDVQQYAVIRFVAGIGLAGELGAGITLISETMDKENRGYGTMMIVSFGAIGAVFAAFVAETFDWKIAYIIGGALGLALLLLRVNTMESSLFKNLKQEAKISSMFSYLFFNPKQLIKYLSCIMIGLPIWFIVGVLIALCETFAKNLGVVGSVKVSTAIALSYVGLCFGDILSGTLSQILRSRKKVVLIFLLMSAAVILLYVFDRGVSVQFFYFLCFALGFSTGFWAIFVSIASEQFGTNIRSTVTNTVPNFVRGAVVPITLSFKSLMNTHGIEQAALIVGGICFLLSAVSVLSLHETFAKELDYVEPL